MVRMAEQVHRELEAAWKIRDLAKLEVKQAVVFLSVAEVRLGELLDEYRQARSTN